MALGTYAQGQKDCAVSATGTVFRILRHTRGKSTRRAAKDARLDYTIVNRIENGLTPTPDQVRQLARAYRVREENLHKAIVALSNEARD